MSAASGPPVPSWYPDLSGWPPPRRMAGRGEPSTSQLPPSGPLDSCPLPRGEGQRGWLEKGSFTRRGPLPGLGPFDPLDPLDPLVAGHCYFCTYPF